MTKKKVATKRSRCPGIVVSDELMSAGALVSSVAAVDEVHSALRELHRLAAGALAEHRGDAPLDDEGLLLLAKQYTILAVDAIRAGCSIRLYVAAIRRERKADQRPAAQHKVAATKTTKGPVVDAIFDPPLDRELLEYLDAVSGAPLSVLVRTFQCEQKPLVEQLDRLVASNKVRVEKQRGKDRYFATSKKPAKKGASR